MKLSILIPSNRPEGLDQFLVSLASKTRKREDIEVVVLVDDDKNFVTYGTYRQLRIVTIHRIPDAVLNISVLQHECLKLAEGEWIMLGNDDCIIETNNWDDLIRLGMDHCPDKLSLVFPNDGMFGPNLACFPIISRKLIDLVNLFPMPYHRYKVDDTIFNLFPAIRRLYLAECKFTHLNDKGTEGFKLNNGKIYPIDKKFAELDNKLWIDEAPRRIQMARTLNNMLGVDNIKVMIGIPTGKMARDAIFYTYYEGLNKPLGTLRCGAHGQSPAENRNTIIKQALEFGCSHILFIDDDMVFEPDALNRLLAHDVDVVSGFYLSREYPHKPVVFDERDKDEACKAYYPDDKQTGLVKVVNCGFGFVLIKIDVFLKLQYPWLTLGYPIKDSWCDDIPFFNKVVDAGYEVYCDLDCLLGHMTSVTVRPMMTDSGWNVTYDTSGIW